MTTEEAVHRMRACVARKHLARNTGQSYGAWLKRYCEFVRLLSGHCSSEEKLEQFLSALARDNVAASTQNQAFNAILFFYKQVLGVELKNINALRARRPAHLRHAPSREDTLRLLKAVEAGAGFAVSLVVRLLYGCGLRVCEPLNLRVKDVSLEAGSLTIRGAKGGKDRVVPIPCSVTEHLREQLEAARAIWRRDQLNKIPLALPHQLARKYPAAQWDWNWAWVFPAVHPVFMVASGSLARVRLHEVNIQRAVKRAGALCGVGILPHELRHAYATHCLNRGANPRAIQQAMGHQSLETTMGYLHVDGMLVASPLDA